MPGSINRTRGWILGASAAALIFFAIPTAGHAQEISICVKNGLIKSVNGNCSSKQTEVSWSQIGASGSSGPQGATGVPGPAGQQGPPGLTGLTGPARSNGSNGSRWAARTDGCGRRYRPARCDWFGRSAWTPGSSGCDRSSGTDRADRSGRRDWTSGHPGHHGSTGTDRSAGTRGSNRRDRSAGTAGSAGCASGEFHNSLGWNRWRRTRHRVWNGTIRRTGYRGWCRERVRCRSQRRRADSASVGRHAWRFSRAVGGKSGWSSWRRLRFYRVYLHRGPDLYCKSNYL